MLDITIEELRALGINVVDSNMYKKIESKVLNDFDNSRLYRGISINLDVNKDVKPEPLKYKNKIGYNLKWKVVEILKKRGKVVLMIANAGGGKTYTTLQVASELVEANKDNNVVYILAVPNTSQSNQNQIGEDLIEFGFESIVGKQSKIKTEGSDKTIAERLKEGFRKFSCVYDKTHEIVEEAKKQGLETVLIVDECHKLIWDTYRVTALEGMESASVKADMVLMMSATPDVCKNYYKFDEIYEFIDEEVKNNLEKFKIIYSNNWKFTLRKQLRRIKEEGKVALVKINNIDEIDSMKESLEKQGYLVEKLTSTDKNGYTFKTIEQFGLIGADVDVVLCTSVIECGISLKDKDIVPVEIIKGYNDFNMDNTIQFFARPRKKVSEGIMIVKNYQDEIAKDIEEFEKLKAKAEAEAEEGKDKKIVRPKTRRVKDICNYIISANREATIAYKCLETTLRKKLETESVAYVREHILEEIRRIDRTGAIEFDTENLKLYINSKEIIKHAFNKRNGFIISSAPLKLQNLFEGKIFYDEIELETDLGEEFNEEDVKSVNEEKAKKKLLNEAKKVREDEYREWLKDKNLVDAIPDLLEGKINRANIKNYNLDISLRDLIEFRDSSLFDLMKICFRNFTLGETVEIITSKYSKSGEYITKTDIKSMCERKHTIEQMKLGYYKDLNTKDDIICDIIQYYKTNGGTRDAKQINFTDELVVIINAELNRNRCPGFRNKNTLDILSKIEDYNMDWKTIYTKENIKKLETAISSKSGIRPQTKNKIVSEVGKIYNINTRNQDGKEYLRINNPIKKFNFESTLKNIIESK